MGSRARARWVLLAGIATGSTGSATARADDAPADPDDPRATFGLKKKPTEAPVRCDDKREFGCAIATDPLDDTVPYALSTWLSASYLLQLPVTDATHDAVAHYALGAGRDEQGVQFGGATGLENRWTIDGAPADNARSGGVDTRIPLTFLAGIRVTAGGFAARDRASTGGTIDAVLLEGTPDHRIDARLWGALSGSPRARPIAPNSFQLRRLSFDPGLDLATSVVATGPFGDVLGGTAWYAAGVAPQLGFTTFAWDTKRLVDRDHDNIADHDDAGNIALEPIATDERRVASWFVPAMARAGFDRGPHHVAVTLIGHAAYDERHFALATVQAGGIDRKTFTGDAIATWRGTWKSTRARAQLAWHRSTHYESAHDAAAADTEQFLTAYVPATLAEDPALATACTDADPTMFAQCPVPFGFFASGGAGLLVDQIADHPSATADVAHQLGDANVLRAGATFEDVRLVTRSRYTGGAAVRSLFPGHEDRVQFHGTGECSDTFEGPCDILPTSELNFRTRYTAAYLEDTFQPARNIHVDGGLRWELMWVGTALHFSNQLAPRLGIAWDVLGDGRSRVWASMGRTHAYLPAGLGETVLAGDRRVRDITIANIGTTRTLETAAPLAVDKDIAPATQDEATAGVEIGLARTVRVTAWIQGRSLRAIETTAGELTNPTDGKTPAGRESTTVAAELQTNPTGKLALRFGYLFNRTVGTTTGAFDPRQGAVLYAGSDFDGDLINLFGRLPTDLGHRFFLEATRRGHLAGIPVALSTRMSLNSGRPRNVIAVSADGVAELLPRGSYGRSPMIAQTNVQLLARWRGLEFTLDVFNLFDRHEATNLDEIYTSRIVHPIDHGTPADLVFIKTEGGSRPARSTSFQYPTAFQAPISVALGIHYAF